MNICSSNVPLLRGFGPVKDFQRLRPVLFSGLHYRGRGEVRKQTGGRDLRWCGLYGCIATRWFLRGKRYRVNISYKGLRSLLASGLGMCELEGREGMMGHPTGLVTFDFSCIAVHQYG